MKKLICLLFLCKGINVNSQIDSSKYLDESIRFIAEQNEHYTNKETSPLNKKARKAFTGHRFYEVDLNYVVKAEFTEILNGDTIVMKTSADTEKVTLNTRSFISILKINIVIYSSIKVLL